MDEIGFFTYHDFVTITTSSRIISRDNTIIPEPFISCRPSALFSFRAGGL
jgi:hypothetical protein